MWVTHHSLFTRIASVDAGLLRCNLALLLAASVLPFPTAELAFAMQHGSHGGTISALLLYAVGFQPAVSPGALKEMGQQIRQWRTTHQHLGADLRGVAGVPSAQQ